MPRNLILLILVLVLPGQAWPCDEQAQNVGEQSAETRVFRAGACAVDVSPTSFPVLVNGGFLQNSATKLNDPVRAKSLVLDDGSTRLAIVVVDSCMMPRELLDRAKEMARDKTGIPTDRILISATHTHSAPAAMGALGCPADAKFVSLLPGKIAESIERAAKLLEPARVGWNAIDDHEHTFCRRWIRRPDKMLDDPFGQRTVRANMHPGYQNPDAITPSGPVDPALTLLSIKSRQGRPIAVLANYSMHYFGAEPISADYFGRFAADLAKRIGATSAQPPFVAIMSQGTSGDQMWMDYGRPKKDPGLEAYGDAVARFGQQAYQSIAYRDWVSLAMAETRLVLSRRVPDAARLAWARGVIDRMAGRTIPASLPEVYAREAIILHEEPTRELKLQAVRIGELGIAAIPNEVFAITGLKIKARSPLETTMNIELANGSEGYIPPPEQHALGGYTTWPARTAALEIQAEPKIVAAVLGLLEQVAGRPRRAPVLTHGPYARSVLASKPLAYWRLDEMQGPLAIDSSGHDREARYEGLVAYYLPGPDAAGLSPSKGRNHAVYFAGGSLQTKLKEDLVSLNYTIELWFWSGLADGARPITGDLVFVVTITPGPPSAVSFGMDGLRIATRRQVPKMGVKINDTHFRIPTAISTKAWHHLALIRQGRSVTVTIDGKRAVAGDFEFDQSDGSDFLIVGQRTDGGGSAFEGKIDEVAVYDRVLPAEEIAGHLNAARQADRRERGISP